MNNIPENLLENKQLAEWHHPAILDFIRTGNPAAWQKIPRLDNKKQLEFRNILPFPPDWTPEADRVIQIAINSDLIVLINTWLGQFCRYWY